MENLKCDICHHEYNEVLVLRECKFTKRINYLSSQGQYPRKSKLHRVCLDCGKELFKRKLYNFGIGWQLFFLDSDIKDVRGNGKFKYLQEVLIE